jgi:uncharacterized protein (DUF1810 family)
MNTQQSKHQVHNLIILDESGSMGSIAGVTISGFNELVQSIKSAEQQFPEQEHFVTFVSFNSNGIKPLHRYAPAATLQPIDGSSYRPNACTPLFDAIGVTLTDAKRRLETVAEYSVLVTIMTDGLENASREYSGKAIKCLIEELKAKGWAFTYIGTDHDIESVAESLSIGNRHFFSKSSQGVNDHFAMEKIARREWHKNIRHGAPRCETSYYDESLGLKRFYRPVRDNFAAAKSELEQSRKRGHWMWFMFPQIAGLGQSDTARQYAIEDLEEAESYMYEFGHYLVDLCNVLLAQPETDPVAIFGITDAMKLKSSMTLFTLVPNTNPVFQAVLDRFYGGQKDLLTLEILERQGEIVF